jgi:tetratricopeptide (TPR) repeat protein
VGSSKLSLRRVVCVGWAIAAALVLIFSLGLSFAVAVDAYTQAVQAFQAGRYQDTLTYLSSFEPTAAELPASYNLKSLALMELHRWDEALAASAEARRLEPANVNYVFNAGMIYLAKKDFHGAEDLFRSAIRRFPNASRLYEGWGEALFAVRRFKEAEVEFSKAAELDPESASAQVALAKVYYTTDRNKLDGPAAKAVHLAPDNYLACYFYGRHLIEDHNDLAEGRKYLAKAVALAPNFTDGLIAWGDLLSNEHNWPGAAEAYEKALASDPADARVYYKLFSLYRKQGNREKAEWALTKYKELEAKNAKNR